MPKHIFKIAAFGIILDEQGRVLLCHRTDHDLWNMPGGGMEDGETPWDALVREVKEETGLDVAPARLTGVYSKPEKNTVVFNYLCQVTGGELTLSDESDKLEYFALNDIPPNTSPKQVARINDFFADRNNLHFRTESGTGSIDLVKQGKL